VEGKVVFAIVDVSRRASRGQILMLLDDNTTASEIASELNRRAVEVSVQSISSGQLEQVQTDVRAGAAPPRARAIA
jgi:hypothetical protein